MKKDKNNQNHIASVLSLLVIVSFLPSSSAQKSQTDLQPRISVSLAQLRDSHITFSDNEIRNGTQYGRNLFASLAASYKGPLSGRQPVFVLVLKQNGSLCGSHLIESSGNSKKDALALECITMNKYKALPSWYKDPVLSFKVDFARLGNHGKDGSSKRTTILIPDSCDQSSK